MAFKPALSEPGGGASLPQQRAFLVEIGAVELGEGDQTIEVVDGHLALLEGQQPFLPQLAQDAVDVDGAETESIGQKILRERAGKALAGALSNEHQPGAEFEQEMRRAFEGVAPADADEMFHHHRFVPRCRPQNGSGEARRRRERLQEVAFQHLRGLDRRDRLDIVVGGVEQDRAETEEIAGDLEVDDLPRSVPQELVGADPALGEDVGGRMGLALMDDIASSDEGASPPVKAVENFEVGL